MENQTWIELAQTSPLESILARQFYSNNDRNWPHAEVGTAYGELALSTHMRHLRSWLATV